MNSKLMTGAQILVQGLMDEGITHVFGYPGGAIMPTYDVIYDAPLTHILTRHEQGAAHAADGYARATGRVGVCIATSGPGATNLVTGLSTAHMDSVPLVAITGQVPASMIGNDSFQGADIYGISIPVTKYNYLVKDVRNLQHTVKEAFYVARTGRKGPVLIDFPKDVQSAKTRLRKIGPVRPPGRPSLTEGHPRQLKAMVAAVKQARRPVIYAGGGLVASEAGPELAEFVALTKIPVTTTLLGKGIFSEMDSLSLGMLGMHGTKYANHAIYESDLLIALGVRFDDRVAGNVKKFAPLAKVVHVDIDPAEIGKRVAVDIPVVGNLKTVLGTLNRMIEATGRKRWIEHIARLKKDLPLAFPDDGKLRPQHIIRTLSDMTRGEILLTTDVGQHQMWAALYYQTVEPRRFITSGGAGTMGFGFPAAIGASVARTDLPVVTLTGDGSFQMCIQELATARMYNLPVKIFIMNNGYLGMVRQWQEIFHDRRYSHTCLSFNPDFCKVAEGYEIPAFRVTEPSEVQRKIDRALNTDGPVLV
ncbi:acetolactate synthase, large subunit, biosynthetic type [delta proteobacterium NaphS2]|nr:acetolactate synthase, large subunit, biosynthetic type [delta proteobacterium NaphS2]